MVRKHSLTSAFSLYYAFDLHSVSFRITFQFYYTVSLWVPLLITLSCRQSLNRGWRPSRYRHFINRRLILINLFLSLSVAPYSISLSLFILTGYGVNVLLIVIFFKEAGKLFTWDSSSRRAFNALDTWQVPIGFASDEGIASSSAPFYSIYKGVFLISPISSLLIFERERPSPWIPSPCSLAPSPRALLPLKPFLQES